MGRLRSTVLDGDPGCRRRRPLQAWPQLLGHASTTERALHAACSAGVVLLGYCNASKASSLAWASAWAAWAAWVAATVPPKEVRASSVAGRWRYVYRAIDQFGQVIDVFVSPHG
jgi:hypothetical protein